MNNDLLIEEITDLKTSYTSELLKLFDEWKEYEKKTGIGVFCQEKEEYNVLHQIALLPGITNILELGPGAGCSTMCMIAALNMKGYGHIDSVDILPEEALKVVSDRKRFTRYGMDTNTFFAQNIKKYDMIFIDACHQDQQVFKDIENSRKILNLNGVIVCHDLLHFDDTGKSQRTDVHRHVIGCGQGMRIKLIESIGHGLGVMY